MAGKLNIGDLKKQLEELKKKETIAQTREQVLTEEKQLLLSEAQKLLEEVEKLNLFSKEELVPNNLPNIVSKLYSHIESELTKIKIPPELTNL
jgi:hypothetical protein